MIVLVTGAYGGIGTAVCHQFLQLGATLVISGKNSEKLLSFSQQLSQQYDGTILPICADVSDPAEVNALFKHIHQTFKQLDVMVHCAGCLYEAPLMLSRYDDIVENVQVNLTSNMLMAQQSSKLMIRQKSGVIILLSSIVAQQGVSGQSVYSAAKSGVEGLTRALAKELGGFGIRVNAVAPGVIDTPMVAHFSTEQKHALINNTALGRLGNVEDIANAILFLSSSKASYITGQIIAVDGGLVV